MTQNLAREDTLLGLLVPDKARGVTRQRLQKFAAPGAGRRYMRLV